MLGETCFDLQISLLGHFEIRCGDVLISDNINRSHKTWNLLAYLLSHRNRPIPQSEFIDVLWSDDDNRNPTNALKTQFYRLRTLLEPITDLLGDCILSQRGSYCWNSSLACHIDAEIFDQLCAKASDESLSTEERIQHYIHAMDLFQGEYLPKLTGETWTIPLRTHYHAIYLDIAKDLFELLDETNQYSLITTYCTKAIQVDDLDEQLHSYLILCFIRQNNYVAALKHYDIATDILYRNLGVKPSENLRALYQQIMDNQKTFETDLGIIQKDLQETEFDNGGFYCEYGFFKRAYQLSVRRMSRLGLSFYLALITLSNSDGSLPSLDVLNYSMGRLLDSIKFSLRSGDVVSKYSGAQFVIMLSAINYENSLMVMERIVKNYYKQNRRSILKIQYKLQELTPPEPEQ